MKIKRFFGGLGSFLFFLAVLIIMILLSSYNPRAFWILVGALALVTVGLILLLKRISARRAADEAASEEAEGAGGEDAPAVTEEIVVAGGEDPMAAFYEGTPNPEEEEEEDPGTELPAAEGETRWEPGERRVGTDAEPGVYALRVLFGEGYLVVSRAKGGIRVASPMGRCDYERADVIPDLKLESGETVTTDGTLVVGIRKL